MSVKVKHLLLLQQDQCRALHHCCPAQREAVRLSRKNDNMRPFEPGGETELEHLAQRADAGLFLMDSHSKKRPHNLILGRLFNHRLLDLVGAHCGVCAWPGWLSPTMSYLNMLGCPRWRWAWRSTGASGRLAAPLFLCKLGTRCAQC